MKRPSNELIARLSLVFSFMVLVSIISEWVFVQFVHFHAQNNVLSPADFNFDLATKEDYAKMSDPAVREFTYADGRYLVKAPAYDELQMASYYAPSVDGRFYLQVTAKGTAPFVRYWTNSLAFVLISVSWALVFNFWNYRNLRRVSQPAAALSESDHASRAP
jgi:hypothetical protein